MPTAQAMSRSRPAAGRHSSAAWWGENYGGVSNAYSTGAFNVGGGATDLGGFAGYNDPSTGSISASFWDTTTSGQTTGIGAGTLTGATGSTTTSGTNNLLALGTYSGAGWSIGTDLTADTWVIFNGQTRPLLSMEYGTTITNAHQLQLVGINSTTLAANYTLANNIDASGTSNAADVWGTSMTSGTGFVPIGNGSTNFTGTLNGQGHTINDLYINAPSSAYVGLFGNTAPASTIENVGVTNAQISGSNIPIDGFVGGLVGYSQGTLASDYVTGSVSSTGDTYVGGLVGYANLGTISSSYNTASVTGFGGSAFVGGLAGQSNGGASILNCYNSGTISGFDVGGLVGYNNSAVTDSYSDGPVSGTATVGALFFFNGGLIKNTFWDSTTAGVSDGVSSGSSIGVLSATTAQLESQSYIAANATASPAYDFTNVWTTNGGTTTPQLIGLAGAVSAPTLDLLSGTAFIDSGMTPNNSGTTIDLIFNGTLLGSTTTNSAGGFSFSVSASDLTSGILLTDATNSGNTYYQANTPASTISGVDIWGGTLRVTADAASNTALSTAAGSLTGAGINYGVSGGDLTTNPGINMNILASYTLDGNVYADGLLTTNAASVLGASSVVSLSGNSVNLSGTINDTDYILVKAVAGDITVTGPVTSTTSNLIMLSTGNITVDGNVSAANVTLQSDLNGTGVGTVAFHNGAQVSSTGNVLILYNPSVNPAGSAVNTTSYVNPRKTTRPT